MSGHVRIYSFNGTSWVQIGQDIDGSSAGDMFGSSMLPMGGFCGGADAFGGAVEHQHDGNPHLHFHVHVVNIYQHGTLADVAKAIRDGFLDADILKSYSQHICSEEYPDIEQHNKELPLLEKEG